MTVVAYRDGILAADKQTQMGYLKGTVTKIFRCGDAMIGLCGTLGLALQAMEWVKAGAAPEDIPEFQKSDDFQCLILIRNRQIWIHEQGTIPFLMEDEYAAIGSGSECAMAAMWCGKGAVDAVHCAIALNSSCGIGVDVLLDDQLLNESLPWA